MARLSFEEFNTQVRVFTDELSKAFEYDDLEEVVAAKLRMHEANEILDDDIPVFMAYASYIGSLFRLSYYKYVHKRGFDVRALADASVLTLMFTGTYRFEFEPYMRRKEVKTALDKTRYPNWTKIGLLGGSTGDLVKFGNEFAQYMDALKEEESSP